MEDFSIWNTYARQYLTNYGEDPTYDAWYQAWQRHLPQGGKVLEWGCGPGIMAKRVLNSRPDLHWLGLDAAEAMVEAAREWVPNAQFETKNANDTWPQGPFEGVAAGFLAPYLSRAELGDFLVCAKTSLKRGGALFLSWIETEVADQTVMETNSTGDQMIMHYHSLQTVQGLLENQGFHITDTAKFQPKNEKMVQWYRGVVAILQHD